LYIYIHTYIHTYIHIYIYIYDEEMKRLEIARSVIAKGTTSSPKL
jgi:hypothetical protein